MGQSQQKLSYNGKRSTGSWSSDAAQREQSVAQVCQRQVHKALGINHSPSRGQGSRVLRILETVAPPRSWLMKVLDQPGLQYTMTKAARTGKGYQPHASWSQCIIKESQGQELKQGRNWSRDHGRILRTGLFSVAHSACFFYNPGPPSQG